MSPPEHSSLSPDLFVTCELQLSFYLETLGALEHSDFLDLFEFSVDDMVL